MLVAMKYAAVVAGLSVIGAAAVAQDTGVKRTILQKADVAVGVPHESLMGQAELGPGASIGRHSHPGVEMGYVLEGEFDVMVGNESPRRVKAGDSYLIPAGTIHDAKSVGATPGKVLAAWVVEKGKPLSTPAK